MQVRFISFIAPHIMRIPIMIIVGEVIKDVTPFSPTAVDTTYFGNCPTSAPSISAAPSTSSDAPSAKPTEFERERILPLSCSGNRYEYRIDMNPGNNHRNDISMKVMRRGEDGLFSRRTFKKVYKTARHVEEKCLWKRLCMKVVVHSKSGSTGLSRASFSASWNGE